jgi:hypothetical protein
MAQPALTAEQLQEAWEAVCRYKTVTAAARALGINPRTMQHRFDVAKHKFKMGAARLSTGAQGVILPAIPKAGATAEELIEARKREFLRAHEAETAKQWMRFTIEEPAPFALAFVGDPHVDDRGCDWVTLERHLDLIEKTPGMFGVGLGDWTNNWTGRLARLYAEQPTGSKEAWTLAEWVLTRPIWMLLLRGNHDMWSGAGDPMRWIVDGAVLQDWQARFEVACSDIIWRVHAAHDFPGTSMWNRLHAPLKRAKMSGHDADLYIAGHRHNWGLAEEQDEHSGRVAWLARAKGYKALDSYAANLGHGQAQNRGQTITAICTPADGKMRCFSDLDEAASYLTWLRRPRVRVKAA